jgi:hypothetical protein
VSGPTVAGPDGVDEKSRDSDPEPTDDTTDGGGCRTRTTRRGSKGSGVGTTVGEAPSDGGSSPERARRRLCGSSSPSDSRGVPAREEGTEKCVGVPWWEEATENAGTGDGTSEAASEKRGGAGEGAAETRAERGPGGTAERGDSSARDVAVAAPVAVLAEVVVVVVVVVLG